MPLLHHAGMIHRLDPHIPVIWRGPTSLQIGLNRDPLVLDETTPTLERLIGALTAGASTKALQSIAARSGSAPVEIGELLERLRPHLAAEEHDEPGVPLAVEGAPALLETLRAIGAEAGPVPQGGPAMAGVLTADYVLRPDRISAWMSAGFPHVTVEFDDDGIRLSGPILPGVTACARCRQLHRSDDDPGFPAMASQLSGAVAGAVPVSERAAAVVLALRRLRSLTDTPDVRLTRDGEIRELAPAKSHPRCGCRARPESATPPADGAASSSVPS